MVSAKVMISWKTKEQCVGWQTNTRCMYGSGSVRMSSLGIEDCAEYEGDEGEVVLLIG